MTHVVIDKALLDALLAAGDAVSHAADNRLCECQHNVPYEHGQVKRVLVTKCFRCRSIAMLAAAREPVAKAITEQGAKEAQPA